MGQDDQQKKDDQLKKDIDNVEKSGIESDKKDSVNKVKESRGKVVLDAFEHIKRREFKEASNLLIRATATFSATEICSLQRFILLTVVTETRERIKKDIHKSADVIQIIEELPALKQLLNAFVECNYRSYMDAFTKVLEQHVAQDPLLSQHILLLQRRLRLRAYQQFLQPFKSVRLSVMANTFGLSEAFLESEICRFVAAGKLNVKMDLVEGLIVTVALEQRDEVYKQILNEGDSLLNKLQNLSRVLGM